MRSTFLFYHHHFLPTPLLYVLSSSIHFLGTFQVNSTEAMSAASSTVIVITGASRGFGRALAMVAASSDGFGKNPASVKLVLVARSEEGLRETAARVEEQQILSKKTSSEEGAAAPPLKVTCLPMDLGNLEMLDEHLDELFREIENDTPSSEREVIFIQNAGTIGHLGPSRESPSLKDMQNNVDLNITSCLWTSARLANYARSSSTVTSLTIVNISSLVAIADFPTFGIYSAGKAARNKFHTLIAKEEESSGVMDTMSKSTITTPPSSRIRTLNYAPVSMLIVTTVKLLLLQSNHTWCSPPMIVF
jgi:sepiapterin reductase